MQCYNCKTENPEQAVFCKHCGRRLDGMALCPACGKPTPQDGEFCINCGSNRNAPVYAMPVRFPEKAEAPSSSASVEGKEAPRQIVAESAAFAAVSSSVPAKEEAAAAAAEEKSADAAAEKKGKKLHITVSEKKRKVFGLISLIFSALTALIGMVFVLLIGCVPTVGVGGASVSGGAGFNLFYYFGDAYKAGAGTTGVAQQMYTYAAVFGTVCTVLALAGTAVFFVLAILRFIKVLRGQAQQNVVAPAAAVYLAFLCGVALFLLCTAQSTTAAGVTTSMSATSATVAGIVLGALFLTVAVVFSVLAKGEVESVRGYVFHASARFLHAVFTFVVLGVIGYGVVSFTMSGITTSYGISNYFAALAAPFANNNASAALATQCNVSIALVAVLILACAAFGFCMIRSGSAFFGEVGEKASRRTQMFMLFAGIFATAIGAVICVLTVLYASAARSAMLAAPIVLIVFGILLIVGTLVYKKLSKRFA